VVILFVFTSLPIFDKVYADIEKLIFSNLMPTNSQLVMEYLNHFIASTDKLGFIGLVYVIFAVFMFFKNYDYIVNAIFHVPSRDFSKASGVYILLLILMPLLMGTSFYLSDFIQGYLDKNTLTSYLHLYTIIPYFIIWMMFYIAYQLSPNTDIEIPSALISSFIASLIWYLSKSAFVFYVIHNKTYESIYGSVSTLLFFFLWIYISWAIFIHGLKFCDLLNRHEEIEHI